MGRAERIFFDLSIVAILHYVGLYMDMYSRPVTRGFHCGDTSLGYEKQDNTITPLTVLTGSIFVPMATMLLIDVISGRRGGWDTYHNIMVFEIGGLLVYVSNNILKYKTGLPRPYFLTVCQPDYSQIDCSNGAYIVDPKCTGDENEIKWAGLTFPSMHSSFTAYGLTYLMVFLYRYNKYEDAGYFFGIFTAFAHVSAITWAVFVGVSRVLDRRHHVIDVIAGALWGFSIAVIIIVTIRNRYENTHNQSSKTGNKDLGLETLKKSN